MRASSRGQLRAQAVVDAESEGQVTGAQVAAGRLPAHLDQVVEVVLERPVAGGLRLPALCGDEFGRPSLEVVAVGGGDAEQLADDRDRQRERTNSSAMPLPPRSFRTPGCEGRSESQRTSVLPPESNSSVLAGLDAAVRPVPSGPGGRPRRLHRRDVGLRPGPAVRTVGRGAGIGPAGRDDGWRHRAGPVGRYRHTHE